ncbi:MAG: hypothetical protein KAI67_03465 [Candidatus Pacebacteria bacterium]|nr:hypothetical protein [Candidatus Aenigmarchaeota archaeon]MCK5490875.1 hypothetical protein [Candidatus Paceibacterota bacterium]
MITSEIYIIISIVILAIIALLVFFLSKNKKDKKLTPLAGLAFGFILAGILFGDTGLVGYSLMGTGIVLAVIDIIIKLKKK